MGDARDALINAALDPILAYGQQIPASQRMGALPLPFTLRILPLYILAMLKSVSGLVLHSLSVETLKVVVQYLEHS